MSKISSPMTTVEYLRRKNKILKELTGITLVPESQIVAVPKLKLKEDYDGGICPYCIAFDLSSYAYAWNKCKLCPMSLQDNGCYNVLSTYNQVRQKLPEDICDIPAIQELVKEYNSQFK